MTDNLVYTSIKNTLYFEYSNFTDKMSLSEISRYILTNISWNLKGNNKEILLKDFIILF